VVKYFKNALSGLFRVRFERWLDSRMPAKVRQNLSGRNIFILPSKFGFIFCLFVILLFVLATNYQNNLILFFAYLHSSLFVSAMFHSFFNLRGLSIELSGEFKGYANDSIAVPVTLLSQKCHYSLALNFVKQQKVVCQKAGCGSKPTKVVVPYIANARGIIPLERLIITSEYSLGLFKCWTKLAFPVSITVYPQALAFQQNIDPSNNKLIDDKNEKSHSINRHSGVDEFIELSRYRQGESISKIAWKHLAKGQGWLTKQYGERYSDIVSYSLQDMPASDIEIKLQMLCFIILQSHHKGDVYGVVVGATKLSASSGQQHLLQCLTTLAQYEVNPLERSSFEKVGGK